MKRFSHGCMRRWPALPRRQRGRASRRSGLLGLALGLVPLSCAETSGSGSAESTGAPTAPTLAEVNGNGAAPSDVAAANGGRFGDPSSLEPEVTVTEGAGGSDGAGPANAVGGADSEGGGGANALDARGGAAGRDGVDDAGENVGGAGDGASGGARPALAGADNADAGVEETPGRGGSDALDAAAPNPALDAFHLAVIGSSTAAGEGASDFDRGWVELLGAALEDTVDVPFQLTNLAQGGTTTSELRPGSGSRASVDAAIDEEPNLILVALAGSNDLSNGTSGDEFIERLSEMRDAAEGAGIPIFFVSTAPKDLSDDEQRTLEQWATDMGAKFEPCWVPIAEEPFEPCYIDIFDLLASDSLGIASEFGSGDGIHLNDAGHEVVFRAALDVVEPYACAATRCD